MSLTNGMGKHWGGFLIGRMGFTWFKKIIQKIDKVVRKYILEWRKEETYSIPVESLTIIDMQTIIKKSEPLAIIKDYENEMEYKTNQ